MPRLTYCPSCSSCATRAASCVARQRHLSPPPACRTVRRSMRFSVACSAPSATTRCTKIPGSVDVVGVELARLDELLDLGDRDPPGHRDQRVEVARGLVEDQVAVPVALRRAHQREVGDDRLLEHVLAAVEDARLLRRRGERDRPVRRVAPRQAALGDLRADAGRRVEGGDPGAAGAQPLGQRALRGQLDLELAREVLPLELLVLADVRARSSGGSARRRAGRPGPSRRRRSCSTRPAARRCPARTARGSARSGCRTGRSRRPRSRRPSPMSATACGRAADGLVQTHVPSCASRCRESTAHLRTALGLACPG